MNNDLIGNSTSKTLADILSCIDMPEFDSILEDYLEKMPWNRESVDELLRAASGLDLWPIHYKLLTDGVAFLTIDEFSELSTHYKEAFDNQLPCEMNSLDDMGYSVFRPDFDSILENYVEKMPSNRESVNEMLKAISDWNLWPIYYKLLTECPSLLTIEEHSKLETDYKKHFSVPLPYEEE